jgi:hypothetical protein
MKYADKENENLVTSKKGGINRSDAHEYERKIQDFSEKLEIVQNKLRTTTEQKTKIIQRLKDSEEENDRLKDQMARQASHNQRMSEEINLLNSRINELVHGNKNLNEKCRTKFDVLNRELEEKEDQMENFLAQLKAKDETIKYYSVNNEQTIRSQNIYKDELDNAKLLNKTLEEKIRSLEKTIDELYVTRKSESTLLLEIEHLKDDNVRLLQMLKTTEEYKDFAYLAENVSGGIKFIKTNEEMNTSVGTSRSKSAIKPNLVQKYKNRNPNFDKDCEKKKIEKEDPFNGDNWVPADAYRCCYDFRNKYNVEMSENLINDLLSALNKIWRDRENKQIARIKTKYQTEVMNLRRKSNMKSSFDEFTAVKTINKLKKDLKNVRDDLRTQVVEKNKLKT